MRFVVTGIVQGVGFRPFVYRLATGLDLAGWVRNDAAGVTIEVEGPDAAVQAFGRRLVREPPRLSSVEHVSEHELAPRGGGGFEIRDSERADRPSALVSPDTATCDDCLHELLDPDDRRYRYAFTNCTNCGPRFTIVRGIPYDRPYTTMAGFEMCGPCRAEYDDPGDRRFHAQPNACPDCGPTVRLCDAAGSMIAGPGGQGGAEPIARAAALLAEGTVVAVKGLGGFHLACVATDEDAVRRLRGRKHREDKPFAVMVPDLESARRLADLDDTEAGLLASRERPIVLARRRPGSGLADQVAPGHRDLGLMLPYSPLHHLLLADAGAALVMTSGNVSDEPIAYRNDDALERLADIADCFLLHDRPIHTRTDDSVVRVVTLAGRRSPLMLRRSRGYVPSPIPLPEPAPVPLVACGAHLKNTFTVAEGSRAWVGPHIGDLENYETLRSFEQGVAHLEALFEVRPRAVAHDLHPDYLSTRYAAERTASGGLEAFGVQHHHAHLAACLAEHAHAGPALGVVFDGTGLGTDGSVWGGEILVGDAAGFDRIGHLWPVRLPGGAAAIRRPWHMACAWLCELDGDAPAIPSWLEGRIDAAEWTAVVRLARTGVASPVTTSAGRLFDAVSSLCGLCLEATYEGQAAVELEMAAASALEADDLAYPLPARREAGEPVVLDARELVRAAAADLAARVAPGTVARRFHAGLADGTAVLCVTEAARRGLRSVVLSGGVFQNVLLLERLASRLDEAGLDALVPRRLPPNDGGLSYGQAAVIAARDPRRSSRPET
ncbi:MAG TPA: carbamoyltransferase HypF [Gemmatimonadota bacterium]|nr:carbamoyltransferase HypF [Gemmatimonadota bacterium]